MFKFITDSRQARKRQRKIEQTCAIISHGKPDDTLMIVILGGYYLKPYAEWVEIVKDGKLLDYLDGKAPGLIYRTPGSP
jgi:hypothetical protein